MAHVVADKATANLVANSVQTNSRLGMRVSISIGADNYATRARSYSSGKTISISIPIVCSHSRYSPTFGKATSHIGSIVGNESMTWKQWASGYSNADHPL